MVFACGSVGRAVASDTRGQRLVNGPLLALNRNAIVFILQHAGVKQAWSAATQQTQQQLQQQFQQQQQQRWQQQQSYEQVPTSTNDNCIPTYLSIFILVLFDTGPLKNP